MRHGVIHFRFADDAAEQTHPLAHRFIVHDVYVEAAHGQFVVDIWGAYNLLHGLAVYYPTRSFENPHDTYVDEDGETHLLTNMGLPALLEPCHLGCKIDRTRITGIVDVTLHGLMP